jgi:hypothetical protein
MDQFIRKIGRFLLRVIWEFGPPALVTYLIGHLWPQLMSIAGWATAYTMYVILNYCWLQLLRIWHQQGQRADISKVGRDIAALHQTTGQIWEALDALRNKGGEQVGQEIKNLEDLVLKADIEVREANTAYQSVGASTNRRGARNLFIEARPKGQPDGQPITDYVVEDYAGHVLFTGRTQREAVEWAKARGQYPLVARIRHLNDKTKPDHWRSA